MANGMLHEPTTQDFICAACDRLWPAGSDSYDVIECSPCGVMVCYDSPECVSQHRGPACTAWK